MCIRDRLERHLHALPRQGLGKALCLPEGGQGRIAAACGRLLIKQPQPAGALQHKLACWNSGKVLGRLWQGAGEVVAFHHTVLVRHHQGDGQHGRNLLGGGSVRQVRQEGFPAHGNLQQRLLRGGGLAVPLSLIHI